MLLNAVHYIHMNDFQTGLQIITQDKTQPPLMAFDNLLSLFDSYWFERQILKKQAQPPSSEPNPVHKITGTPNPSLSTISTRSMDDHVSSSSGSSVNSFSPNSVLLSRALQPIFSGKQMKESLSEVEAEDAEICRTGKKAVETERLKSCSGGEQRKRNRGRKNRKLCKGSSKSLSELEFEEIKGFVELGFTFSEEDMSSEFLATVLPGLQRLGLDAQKEGFRRITVDGSGIARPYLSEVWRFSERNKMKRRENPPLTMSWEELPSVNSKIDMKNYLRSWAHTVASSVK